jgi:choline-sulfatase
VRKTPVSLVDAYPTVLKNGGLSNPSGMPGRSLFEIASLPDDEARPVFSEYHATAARTAEYMIKRGRYKYIHYVGYEPELYDLCDDPEELHNLAQNELYQGIIGELDAHLRTIVDPEAADAAAKKDQEGMIEKLGGREFLIAKGVVSATPAPNSGEQQ